ncbi:AMP-binding protein [Yinghuangia seranimata]|uniref:AMP-binding protein n=1 Tax=Yinghuangia seranimata TaxID=408067 RepID=UPI00248BE324|nr:AMP-binding protein [Yinghuangia seranimata]MDI2125666.1 AMP-binding protein [Yinghuangia seranimata]
MNPVEILLLRHLAAGHGRHTALVDHERALTYAELTQAARDHAGALAAAGVRRGCRALVVGDDTADTVVAVLGLWWYGCVPVVLSPMLTDEEIAFVARDCGAEYAEVPLPEERRDGLREALRPLPVREPGATRAADAGPPAPFGSEALVQYTSGSTGRPRGVRHGVAGLRAVLDGFGGVLALTPDDTVLSTAKLSFGYGFGNSVLFPLAAGARSVLLAGPVDPYSAITAVHRHRPTVLCAVPRLYAALLDAVARGTVLDPSSLRLAVAAGEHLPSDLSARAAAALGVPVLNGLGATEVLHIVLATTPHAPLPDSTGHPVPGVTATVRDDDGRPLPAGAHGRLHIRSASAALGYIDRPDDSARTFADGGVYTGDIAYRTEDGDFRHLCRADDLLNLGGFKVAPAEIEAALRATEGIAEVVVVGGRDEAGLEQAVVHAVPADGVAPESARRALARAIRENLPPHKRPSRVEILAALPTTSTGKLARYRLRVPQEQR